MATIDSEIIDVNYVARLFVQSYYNTLIEERIKMNKYFLPNSQFSFSQGMQESIPVTGRENIQRAFNSIAKSSIKVDLRSGSIDACGSKDEILILIHGVMYIDSVANNYSQTVFLRKNIEFDSFMISYDVIRVENVNEVIAPPEEIAGLNSDASVPQTPLREAKQVEKVQSPPKSKNNDKKNDESTVENTTTTTTTTTVSTTDLSSNKPTNNNKRNNRNKYRNKRNNNNNNNNKDTNTQQQQQQQPPPSPSSSSSLTPSQPLPPPSTNINNQPPIPSSTTTTPKQQQQQQSKPKSRHNNNNNNNTNTNTKENINREKENSKVNSVVIKNLASTVKEETLKEALIQFGEVKQIKIIPSITSHIAFVDFNDEKGKNAVLEFVKSNKLTIESRDLTVEEHKVLNSRGHYQRRRY